MAKASVTALPRTRRAVVRVGVRVRVRARVRVRVRVRVRASVRVRVAAACVPLDRGELLERQRQGQARPLALQPPVVGRSALAAEAQVRGEEVESPLDPQLLGAGAALPPLAGPVVQQPLLVRGRVRVRVRIRVS